MTKKKRLTIISQGKKESGLYINNGNISYISDDGIKTLNNYPSNEKPLFLSELSKRLKNRNWCLPDMKTVGRMVDKVSGGSIGGGRGRRPFFKTVPVLSVIKDGFSYKKLDTKRYVKNLSPEQNDVEFIDTTNIVDYSGNFSSGEGLRKLSEFQKTVQEMKEADGKTFYNSSKVIVDFLSKSISIDLMTEDSYTNTVSLLPVIEKHKTSGLTAKVDLNVRYSKENVIYSRELTFEAFKYEGSTFNTESFIKKLNSDIFIEYLNGVIRVIPESPLVNECIISNCIVTYGCL